MQQTWYKRIPCWFGKHVWDYWDEEMYDPSTMFTKRHSHKSCKYCGKTYITWRNF